MKNITGEKFNRLIAVKFIRSEGVNYYWLFKCDCGNEKILSKRYVCYPSSQTKSCGCLLKETTRLKGKQSRTHGMTRTPFYCVYRTILNRCSNSKVNCYEWYGGRGIKVCERWKTFENFKEDMYENYLKHIEEFGKKQTQIDRIDNNGNYEKSNCRWATPIEQARNTRKNRFITYKGQTKTIAEWAKIVGIRPENIRTRIITGWSVEKALTKPTTKRNEII